MTEPWWKSGVIYQVYPRSFQDSNGDGVGDLDGLAQRLDYVQALGVDAIWISPFYPSPMADFGYDVADYCDVDPLFGDLAGFDRLLAAAHGRGIKIILDYVPNHSSTLHPWFLASRQSREDPKRDWYIWRDPAPDGGPPNNWISDFGGSAWEWDKSTGQYYYHAFLKEQADLNWRNPDLRREMLKVLQFWLDRGVDGFRIDVVWHLLKAEEFPDNPLNPHYDASMGEMYKVSQLHSTDQPGVHDIIADMRRVADGYGQRVLIGEIYLPIDRLVTYYGDTLNGLQIPANFALLQTPWNAGDLGRLIAGYEAALPRGAWPNWVLGNHDRPRIAAKRGEPQARVAAMLLLTLRGTPTIYYGDELGIGSVEIPADRVRDPLERREPGLGLGRDQVRTPMPWDQGPNAGFSSGPPWLPLNADWPTRNVAAATQDPGSMLVLYQRLLAMRRTHDALSLGTITLLQAAGDVLAYERRDKRERLLIVLNLGGETQRFGCPPWAAGHRVLLSTLDPNAAHVPKDQMAPAMLPLLPNEGVILAPSLS
jgi:alpha-glucosidase